MCDCALFLHCLYTLVGILKLDIQSAIPRDVTFINLRYLNDDDCWKTSVWFFMHSRLTGTVSTWLLDPVEDYFPC